MITREQLIEIGRFTKAHGVHGEISVALDCDIDLLRQVKCIIADIDGIYVPFFINSLRPKGCNSALLTLDGITNETKAGSMTGKTLFVTKVDFEQIAREEESDEMPLDYFIGFKLNDISGNTIGTITGVNDSTANVLFIVEAYGRQAIMVPIVEEWITMIDPNNKEIEMNLPEGLLEL